MNRALTIDYEDIIEARVRGESVRSIAKRLGSTVDDVNDVLDQFASKTITAILRVHTLALELERLDGLQETFERLAKQGDVQSALLITRIIERRCILLGLSAPPRVEVIEMQIRAAPAQTSTERIRAAIDRIRLAKPPNSNGDGSEEAN